MINILSTDDWEVRYNPKDKTITVSYFEDFHYQDEINIDYELIEKAVLDEQDKFTELFK